LPGLRVEDQRVAPVLLRREPRREQICRGLAVGPGQPQVVARVAAESVREGDEGGDAPDPHAEHDPPPPPPCPPPPLPTRPHPAGSRPSLCRPRAIGRG